MLRWDLQAFAQINIEWEITQRIRVVASKGNTVEAIEIAVSQCCNIFSGRLASDILINKDLVGN